MTEIIRTIAQDFEKQAQTIFADLEGCPHCKRSPDRECQPWREAEKLVLTIHDASVRTLNESHQTQEDAGAETRSATLFRFEDQSIAVFSEDEPATRKVRSINRQAEMDAANHALRTRGYPGRRTSPQTRADEDVMLGDKADPPPIKELPQDLT